MPPGLDVRVVSGTRSLADHGLTFAGRDRQELLAEPDGQVLPARMIALSPRLASLHRAAREICARGSTAAGPAGMSGVMGKTRAGIVLLKARSSIKGQTPDLTATRGLKTRTAGCAVLERSMLSAAGGSPRAGGEDARSVTLRHGVHGVLEPGVAAGPGLVAACRSRSLWFEQRVEAAHRAEEWPGRRGGGGGSCRTPVIYAAASPTQRAERSVAQ